MTGKLKKRQKARPTLIAPRRRAKVSAGAKPADLIDTLVAASAQALALPIAPAWREGVRRNLHLLLTHAALVDQFPLPDETEPAPVFRA